MSWFTDGSGFRISRTPEPDPNEHEKRFRLREYIGDGKTITLELTKGDVVAIQRAANRALRDLKKESE